MLILPEYSKPYILDSLTAPVVTKYNWMFNAQTIDFVLNPITYLEETTGAAIKVRINNSEFWVPATWQILVTDKETYQIDTVSIASCASIQHIAFAFAPEEQNLRTLDIMVLDYTENMALVHPMIAKSMALVHPVGPAIGGRVDTEMHLSVVIGPHDLYKHLAGKVVGDIFSW